MFYGCGLYVYWCVAYFMAVVYILFMDLVYEYGWCSY